MMAVLSFLMAFLLAMVPLPDWMQDGVRGFVILFLTAYSITFILAYRYRNVEIHEIDRKFGFKKFQQIFIHWAHHLKTIHPPQKFFWVISFSVLMRILEVLAVWMVQLKTAPPGLIDVESTG